MQGPSCTCTCATSVLRLLQDAHTAQVLSDHAVPGNIPRSSAWLFDDACLHLKVRGDWSS
jgi:hypothetical protein